MEDNQGIRKTIARLSKFSESPILSNRVKEIGGPHRAGGQIIFKTFEVKDKDGKPYTVSLRHQPLPGKGSYSYRKLKAP